MELRERKNTGTTAASAATVSLEDEPWLRAKALRSAYRPELSEGGKVPEEEEPQGAMNPEIYFVRIGPHLPFIQRTIFRHMLEKPNFAATEEIDNRRRVYHEERRQEMIRRDPEFIKFIHQTPLWVSFVQMAAFFVIEILVIWFCHNFSHRWILCSAAVSTAQTFAFAVVHNATHDSLIRVKPQSEWEPNWNIVFLRFIDTVFAGLYGEPFRVLHTAHHNDAQQYTEDDCNNYDDQEGERVGNVWWRKLLYITFTGCRNSYRSSIFFQHHKSEVPAVAGWIHAVRSAILIIWAYYSFPSFFLYRLGGFFTFLNPLYPSLVEHFQFERDDNKYTHFTNSTYSFWLNFFTFNMYYHIEHHDFEHVNSHFYPLLKKKYPDLYPVGIQDKCYTYFKIIFSSDYTLKKYVGPNACSELYDVTPLGPAPASDSASVSGAK